MHNSQRRQTKTLATGSHGNLMFVSLEVKPKLPKRSPKSHSLPLHASGFVSIREIQLQSAASPGEAAPKHGDGTLGLWEAHPKQKQTSEKAPGHTLGSSGLSLSSAPRLAS